MVKPSAAAVAQARLIRALANPTCFGPRCSAVRVIETHISYVLLTGTDAYKIKKAVKLDFLNFEPLDARRAYCERELVLNRRFAPTLYVDVVAITGTADAPSVGGDGPAIEYAVRMHEFPQEALLGSIAAAGSLTAAQIDELAHTVAAFHTDATRADAAAPVGTPAIVRELAMANFTEMAPLVTDPELESTIARLQQWTARELEAIAPALGERHRRGFIRECHGDLHLDNIVSVNGRVTLFDCLEFSSRMRWGDVLSDAAFVVMDLHHRGLPNLANRFLNAYLEATGDYDGIDVLRFYVVYRAMVRAKVAVIAAAGGSADARLRRQAECRGYLALAERWSIHQPGAVVTTCGLAGSGKTTLAGQLVDVCGAIRVRTDVERKRLHGLHAQDASRSLLNAGIYSSADSELAYSRVEAIARRLAAAGYLAVCDGTFLKKQQRDRLRTLAASLAVPFGIVEVVASHQTLRQRILERARRGADASEADLAVLDEQIRTAEPLTADEWPLALRYDAELDRLDLTFLRIGQLEVRQPAPAAA
jgi:aminoglycoside phosphotransferase family enzyme/predicted kinase